MGFFGRVNRTKNRRHCTCGYYLEGVPASCLTGENMILFDPRHLKSFPNHNTEATVVYASSEENIDTTIVNGKIVYHRGTFSGGYSEEDLIPEISAELVKMRRPSV